MDALDKRLQLRVVGAEHDEDQNDGVDEHAVVGELAQRLGQDRQQSRGDDGAAHVAQAAQDDEHEDEDRGVEVELGGGELGEVAAEERSRGTGERSGDHEGYHAVLGDGDADGLGCDLVVADGHDSATGAAADQVEHDHERDEHQDGAGDERRVRGNARRTLSALDDRGAALGQVKVVDRGVTGDVEDRVQAVRIDADDQAGDDLLDDLAERERHDRQVVAAKAQNRDTDDSAEDGGAGGTDHDADGKADGIGWHGALERDSGDDTRVGADAHEAGMAERQVTGDADNEVQRDGHDDVGSDRHELTGDHARDHMARLVCLSFKKFMELTYTFSGTYLPRRPAGLTSRTTINTANTMEFARLVEIYA